MATIFGEKRALSRSAMLLVPFRKGYLRRTGMVFLQPQGQEVSERRQTQPSGCLWLLEGYGDRQTHPHFGGGSSQDWGEESAGVLQRPGTQRCEDQLDNARVSIGRGCLYICARSQERLLASKFSPLLLHATYLSNPQVTPIVHLSYATVSIRMMHVNLREYHLYQPNVSEL